MRAPRIGRLYAADLALAGVLFGLGQAEAWVPFRTSLGHGSAIVAALTGAAMTLPLAARRAQPVLVALLVTLPVPIVGAVTSVRLLFFAGFLPLLIVTYTLASRALPLVTLALPFGALLVAEVEVPAFRKPGEIVFDWLWFSVAAAVGFVVRHRSLRAERSESRVATLESERELVLRAERARIARELHDVIAHSVSVIVVQAGAAEPLVEEDPEQARAAFRSIRSTAGEALGEMRRLLGILRTAEDELSLDPQPSVAQARAAARTGACSRARRRSRSGRRAAPADSRSRPRRVPHRSGGVDEHPQTWSCIAGADRVALRLVGARSRGRRRRFRGRPGK